MSGSIIRGRRLGDNMEKHATMTKKGKSVELRLTYRVLIEAEEDITDENLEKLAELSFGEINTFRGLEFYGARLTCVEIDPDECREI